MKNRRRIIGLVAATLLALIGTLSLVGYVRSAKDQAVAQETLVEVYVVDDIVPKGAEADTIISSVSIEQVPARLKQDGAITDLTTVGDRVAATDLHPGDQLVAARLAATDDVVEEVTDKVQIAARLDAERAVGGSLQEGDLVGVYLSFDPFDLDGSGGTVDSDSDEASDDETSPAAIQGSTDEPSSDVASTDEPDKSPNVSRLEFQHVLVTNVQTVNAPVVADEDDNSDVVPAQVTSTQFVVTLALSPEQSERFVFATEFGHVWLSLDPASVEDDGTRAVTLGNVYTVVN